MQSSRALLPVHESPFLATSAVLPDRDGVEQLIVLLKATYTVSAGGRVAVAEEQDAIVVADVHHGDPGTTSIAHAGEIHPPKPLGTDVLLSGHAIAPDRDTREVEVSLEVAQIAKRAVVCGRRSWHQGPIGATSTAPEPFERVPLIYENAFGGTDETHEDPRQWDSERRNPVGRGLRARSTGKSWEAQLLPNIERVNQRITSPDDRPEPVGFGPIGRHWEPRVRYVGTYDEAWLRDRHPLLPADFDDRHHHAAPPDQIVPGYLRGGEQVTVVGCTRAAPLVFSLPELEPHVAVKLFMRADDAALRCDTVQIDTERMRLSLLYRARVPLQGDVLDIQEVKLTVEGRAT